MGLQDWMKRMQGWRDPRSSPAPTPAAVYGDADAAGVFRAPWFLDATTGRSAERGVVKRWHLDAGRSMVSGQRVVDIETEIGVIPVRTRMNGHLAEVLAPVGATVVPGQGLWRYAVSRQAF